MIIESVLNASMCSTQKNKAAVRQTSFWNVLTPSGDVLRMCFWGCALPIVALVGICELLGNVLHKEWERPRRLQHVEKCVNPVERRGTNWTTRVSIIYIPSISMFGWRPRASSGACPHCRYCWWYADVMRYTLIWCVCAWMLNRSILFSSPFHQKNPNLKLKQAQSFLWRVVILLFDLHTNLMHECYFKSDFYLHIAPDKSPF